MTSRDGGRALRIADFIRDEIADILRRGLRDPRVGLVGINDVRVSRDLSYADVYVSALGVDSPEARRDLVAVLNHAAGFFRSELAKRHTLRTTPRIRFHFDETSERGRHLDALIDRALHDDAARRGAPPTIDGGADGAA
ncbi:MAG: 30S ribosome-binding factor RbfA [Pseudomonadales bacterium]